jgi:hypothetical protein
MLSGTPPIASGIQVRTAQVGLVTGQRNALTERALEIGQSAPRRGVHRPVGVFWHVLMFAASGTRRRTA